MKKPVSNDAIDAAMWRTVRDTARDGIVTIDHGGLITTFNRAAEVMFGYAADEVRGQNVSVLMPSPYRDQHDDYLANYQRTGEAKAIGRIRHVHARRKDGRVFPIELSVSASTEPKGFYTAIIRDVLATDRRYRMVIDLAAALIMVVSPDLRVLEFNRAAERLFGIGRELVLERSVLDLAAPEDRDRLGALVARVVQDGGDAGFEIKAARGGHLLSWNASRLTHSDGQVIGVIAIGQDVTEQRTTERTLREERAKLIQAEKLSSIGQLAAGVAHEVNNPLAGVKSLFAMLRDGRANAERRARYFEAIEDGLGRIELTVRDLLHYARPSSGAVGELDLHEVVSACLRLIRPAWHQKHLTVEMFDAAQLVTGDRHGLMQATMNVLLNAAHAAPEGSIIRVGVEVLEDSVCLHFDDSGPGIPEDLRARVCDPFFSTKPPGQGTGLGLAVTQSILTKHGAELKIGARPDGQGARISFVFELD